MTAIISSGLGRLHFAQSAYWISRFGVDIRFVCGWVPKNPNNFIVQLCSWLLGRNLSAGLRKRSISLSGESKICACPIAEFLAASIFHVGEKMAKGTYSGLAIDFAWRLIGWNSKRFLRRFANGNNTVFHVRSGVGHGGAIKLAKRLGMPVIVDHSIAHPAYMESHLRDEYVKNGEQFNLGTSSRFWRTVTEDCEWADILLVNSFFVRDTFIEQGYPTEKIKVVYLGTRPDFFGLRVVRAADRRDRPIRLLFTGNFCFRKGAEYLLRAVRILCEQSAIPFEMDVVGSYDKRMVEQFNASSLPVKFHGPIPQDDLKNFLSQSDIYVFPSLAEGCACSGMEAMAAGLCVVGTHESGFPIEDGVNGYIVPGKDAQAIADKILFLMNNPSEIDRLGIAAAELIRTKYTWEQYAENVKRIYEETLSR